MYVIDFPSVCKLPKDQGPCQADYERWYFDSETEACQPFTWGGCQGNANRFASKDECEETCHELLPQEKSEYMGSIPVCLYAFNIK